MILIAISQIALGEQFINVSFQKRKEIASVIQGNTTTKEKKPTRWLYISIFGIFIASLITGLSILLDKQLNRQKDTAEKQAKKKSDSVTNKMVDNLNNSLQYSQGLINSSTTTVNLLNKNDATQKINLKKQAMHV